jgi:dolichol-phosphate mannosyltransferase
VIPQLIAKWREGNDIVYTIREDASSTGVARRAASKAFYGLMRKVSDVELDFNCADFRLMSRKAVDGFRRFPERARFIRGMVRWMGYRSVAVPFASGDRVHGETKYSLRRLFRFALDGILSFSVVPIRLIGLMGLITSALSLVYILRIIYFVVAGSGQLPDTLPVTTLILFVGGIQMIMLGVLGEYLSRIFIESKQRPLYLIDEVFSAVEGDNRPGG